MRANDFDIQKIIDTVQGTCMESIQSALDYHYPGMTEDDLTREDFDSFDASVFECRSCGWWCEDSERECDEESGEDVCRDCKESE